MNKFRVPYGMNQLTLDVADSIAFTRNQRLANNPTGVAAIELVIYRWPYRVGTPPPMHLPHRGHSDRLTVFPTLQRHVPPLPHEIGIVNNFWVQR